MQLSLKEIVLKNALAKWWPGYNIYLLLWRWYCILGDCVVLYIFHHPFYHWCEYLVIMVEWSYSSIQHITSNVKFSIWLADRRFFSVLFAKFNNMNYSYLPSSCSVVCLDRGKMAVHWGLTKIDDISQTTILNEIDSAFILQKAMEIPSFPPNLRCFNSIHALVFDKTIRLGEMYIDNENI